jgi:hypothetical protein
MWIMTNSGFYSIVEKEWDKADRTLTVRARRLSDLERFLDIAWSGAGRAVLEARPDHCLEPGTSVNWNAEIEIDDKADYRYRARVDRQGVSEALLRLVVGIDYDNFKNSVAAKGLSDHAKAYGSVWSAMMKLQDKGRYAERGGETGDMFADDVDMFADDVHGSKCAFCQDTGEVFLDDGLGGHYVPCGNCG